MVHETVKLPPREVPRLSREECIREGESQLAELAERQRLAGEGATARRARHRRHGLHVLLFGVRVRELVRSIGRRMRDPQRRLGRWQAHARLFAPRTVLNLWTVGLSALLILSAWLTFWKPFFWNSDLEHAISSAIFASSLVALIGMLWSDLFRCPYVVRRIRRRIIKEPESMLLVNLGARKADVVPRNDPLKIIPRTDFFYDVLPGVLARDHKDMQIVVGEPGSGKTTALLGLASLLAQIGFVPVLVPLRTERAIHLLDLARERFCKQIEEFVRSPSEAEVLWSWLRHRRRIAVLADDIDQIGPDGERGFILRQTLLEASTYGQPIIVTARPAGVPAGIAASAISLQGLDEAAIVNKVIEGARNDPGFKPSYVVPRQWLEDWVREGKLVEVPFYLELLAQLAAAGECPKLADAQSLCTEAPRPGRYRARPDGRYEWNPLWVRFHVLRLFEYKARMGRVRPWLGIGQLERESALDQLRRAALGSLVATGLAATAERRGRSERERGLGRPQRQRLEEFICVDDRAPQDKRVLGGHGHLLRAQVSVHEVTDTGERLRILDRDADGKLQFRHRIMQAYLAGCCLAHLLVGNATSGADGAGLSDGRRREQSSDDLDWVAQLLDPHHPEKLTANMTLTFAALYADERWNFGAERKDYPAADPCWKQVEQLILAKLLAHSQGSGHKRARDRTRRVPTAVVSLARESKEVLSQVSLALYPDSEGERAAPATDARDINPMHVVDPDLRDDPDDALIKLTTAADIARAIDCPCTSTNSDEVTQTQIVDAVNRAGMATRWTKLDAIRAVAGLNTPTRWPCVWHFARDPDYLVRRAASDALQADATRAFGALEDQIHSLILRAAARSKFDLDLTRPERPRTDEERPSAPLEYDIGVWRDEEEIPGLRALGWVLPSIVSGLREDPTAHAPEAWASRPVRTDNGDGPGRGSCDADDRPVSAEQFAAYTRSARIALERLVALAYEGGHHDLEESLAQGFKGDAMRHAQSQIGAGGSRWIAGPGWVASNSRLVLDVALAQAESWYSRMLLYQALALYTIAGADARVTLDLFANDLRAEAAEHPFTIRAARLARLGLRRHLIESPRWTTYIWADETEVAGRRATMLDSNVAQLVADVTVLLDLDEGSAEDSKRPFGYMRQLPYCLSHSTDRSEILGTGCPEVCGWGLCPYKQPPVDEPNAHRGVSRAFCRQQRQIARHHTPPWQHHIKRKQLREFWHEMERRART